MSFALSRRYRHVSFLLTEFIISNFGITINFKFSLKDQRGIPQEVTIVVKKGVETKSYEGESKKLKLSQLKTKNV